jgi:hypothetical protein
MRQVQQICSILSVSIRPYKPRGGLDWSRGQSRISVDGPNGVSFGDAKVTGTRVAQVARIRFETRPNGFMTCNGFVTWKRDATLHD